jgi:hypothetical protein
VGVLVDFLEAWRDDLVDWAEGRSPWLRLVLLAYLVWAGANHLADPLYSSWFGGITLIFHEMGHMVFSHFGRTLTILGGTILQLVVPIAAGIHLAFWQRDGFGLGVCLSWLSFSLWNVATYMADALRDELPLVSLGDGEPQHDWGTLLTEWHVLNHADHFALSVRVVATLVWLGSLALGGWLCWRMAKSAGADGG